MKRNKLFLLLVAVLLAALLSTSAAFAEAAAATPKLTLVEGKTAAVSKKLAGSPVAKDEKKEYVAKGVEFDPDISWTLSGVEEGEIRWTSSDKSNLVLGKASEQVNKDTTTIYAPTLTATDVCKATVTGVLWTKDKNYNQMVKSDVSVSFTVTLDVVASRKITLMKQGDEKKQDSYKYYTTGNGGRFVAARTGDDAPHGTYEDDNDALRWKIENTEYATVTKSGYVTIVKQPKAGESAVNVKLTVSQKGEPTNTDSVTLTIEPKLKPEEPAKEEKTNAVTEITFMADTFTFTEGQLGVNLLDTNESGKAYLEIKGNNIDDVLLWSSDNTECVDFSSSSSAYQQPIPETYQETYTVYEQLRDEETGELLWDEEEVPVLDEDGNEVTEERFIQNEDGTYKGHYEYERDEDGNLVTRTEYYYEDGVRIEKQVPVVKWVLDTEIVTVMETVTEPRMGNVEYTRTVWARDGRFAPVYLQLKKATETPVTITVKSKLNPEVKATCKVVVKAGPAPATTQKAKFEEIKFAEESLKIYVGRNVKLADYLITKGGKATAKNGEDDSIIWLSDDDRVVSVGEDGRATGLEVTEAPVTITAKSKNGDKSATIKIEVIKDPEEEKKAFTSVTSSVDALTKYVGDEMYLGQFVTTTSGENTDDRLVWTTSDPAIVDVNRENGYIWANKVGEATITAKSARGSKKAEIKITVKEESEKPKAIGTLKAAVSSLVMYEDDFNNVWDYFLFDNWNDDTILFTSSNRDVVDFVWDGGFDEDDEWYEMDRPYSRSIWAKKPGTATLTATSKLDPTNKTASIKVTVKAKSEKLIPFATVTQAMTDLTIYEGEGINPWDYINVTPEWNDDDFVWTTDNAEIVRLRGQYANFEAVKAGKATITGKAKLGGQTVTFNITVKPETEKPITSIKASQTDLTVYEGDEYWLRDYLTIEPQNHWDELIWASKDESVAIVEHEHEGESGKMYAINEGTTEIVVRSNRNPSATVKFNITVKKNPEKLIQSVKFTENKFTVNLAKTFVFDANPYTVIDPGWNKLLVDFDDEGESIYSDSLVWTSSNPQIAVVEDGNVYLNRDGVKFGDEPVEVTITARSKNNAEAKPASFTLTVKNEKVAFTKITATQATLTLKAEDIVYLGDYGTFESFGNYVTVEPADADDDLVWTSSDPYIVEAAEGWLYIKKPGTATITARSALDPTVEPATITVTVPEEKPVELGFINDAPKKLRFDQYEGDFEEEELAIASLDLNKYLTAKPVYYASDEDYREKLVWKTSNPQVAWVHNGIVYFMAPGDVTITVYDESYTVKAETELTLLKPVITKIGMNASELAMKTGESEPTAWMNLRVLKQDNGKYITKGFIAYDIIWTSSNPHVVDIGKEDGIMTAGEPGTAKITASIVNDEDGSIATGSFTVEVTKVDVESIKFAKSKYTINSSADRYNTVLKFKVSPVNADFNPNDYIVKTEKRVVADVWFEDESTIGLMVNGSGTTTIVIRRASDNKLMAKTKVVVKPLYVDGIRIKEKNVRMNFYKLDDLRLYQNMQVITPVIKPANADYTVRWETSDASVAFVNWFDSLTNEVIDDSSLSSYKMSGTEARIIATGAGQATLTMTVDDGKKVRTAKVKVVVTTRQIVPKLNKTKATITMIKGEDKSLQLTATDKQTGEPIEVKWSSSDKKIAKVTKNGLVKPLKAGKVTITATSTDGLETKATCKITIKQNPVKALKVKKTELTMTVGEEKTLKVKVKPTDAYDKGLTFKSSKSKVVSVDKDGKLVAKKAGKATITAKATDGSKKSVKITVTVKAAEETEAK